MMLILSQVQGLATAQVDYTTAFLHAPIDTGQRFTSKCLSDNLEAVGFKPQTDVDPCLFISENCICLVYVDDTLFFAPEQRFIDEAICRL